MTLDPALQEVLDKAARYPPLETIPLAQLRANQMRMFGHAARPSLPSVRDHTMPGPRGELALRIYRPALQPELPAILYFHGGGFCLCSIETHDGICRQLAQDTGAAVIAAEYALAPEHRFPAAAMDCLAATGWVRAHASALGLNPARIALAGDSAGGTLAAVTALRLRDTNLPPLRALALFYPVTDHPSAGTPSHCSRGTGWGLTSNALRWFWAQYLGPEADPDDPRISPLRAVSFAGVPPTYIATAEYDPLRDEGAALAGRLRRDGVKTEWRHHQHLNHAFLGWAGVIASCTAALDDAAAWLRAVLGD